MTRQTDCTDNRHSLIASFTLVSVFPILFCSGKGKCHVYYLVPAIDSSTTNYSLENWTQNTRNMPVVNAVHSTTTTEKTFVFLCRPVVALETETDFVSTLALLCRSSSDFDIDRRIKRFRLKFSMLRAERTAFFVCLSMNDKREEKHLRDEHAWTQFACDVCQTKICLRNLFWISIRFAGQRWRLSFRHRERERAATQRIHIYADMANVSSHMPYAMRSV